MGRRIDGRRLCAGRRRAGKGSSSKVPSLIWCSRFSESRGLRRVVAIDSVSATYVRQVAKAAEPVAATVRRLGGLIRQVETHLGHGLTSL